MTRVSKYTGYLTATSSNPNLAFESRHTSHPLLTKAQANRLTGVHVTPTVLFDVSSTSVLVPKTLLTHDKGVVEGGISSSFSKEDWEQWLEKNIK